MNRSILFWVTAPALLTGLLLVSVCVGSAWMIQRLQANLARILTENLASVEASADLETRTRQLRHHSFLYLMQPTREGLLQIEEDEGAFQDALNRAQQAGNTPQENVYLSQIEQGYREYREEMARLREEVALRGPQTDFLRLAQTHPIRHIVTPCHELERINRQQLEQTVEDSTRTSAQARAVLLLLGVGGPLGGLLCGYGLVRGLNRSIGRLQLRVRDVVDRLGQGVPDLKPGTLEEINLGAVTVDLRSPAVGGDLGGLDRQLQHILERVEEVMVRLQHQNREMRRAEQLAALGQLAAGVAHEVRNPLTGMKMLVEAALPPRFAPVVGTRPGKRQTLTEEDLHVILGEITRLEQTVQHFLDFARPPALQRRTVDLREVVTRTIDLMRGRARQQGVELRLRLGEKPVLVALDSGQFGTVLVNLLVNALDAQPHGGEVVFDLDVLSRKVAAEREGVDWGLEDGQEGVCCLRIQDRGPGIAAEVVGHLFTLFVSTRPTGTGLGLALSHSIIQEHGGSIRAANRLPAEGGGACFVITLPLSSQPDGAVGELPDRE